MRVLVVGSGAREHALVKGLLRDPGVSEVHAAPGNAGIAVDATVHPVDALDPLAVAALATELAPDLVVIGPEDPLVRGVADAVRAAGIACFGPSAEAARLEGSKAFAKEIMAAAAVPTGRAHVCETPEQAAAALDAFGAPYVVKDDGLAAGKGVVVTDDRAAALAHAAGCARVVIEEYLDGPEVSLFCLTDGRTVVPLAPAQDFKRAYDDDAGPNTGGMGAYSPLDWAPDGLVEDVVARVAQPVVDEMRHRGTPFAGVLYCGLALTTRGVRVIEFNARFGDPETQVVLARLVTPLGALLLAAATGALADHEPLRWDAGAAVTVVIASHGYPQAPRTGDVITGLAAVQRLTGVQAIHAGTARRHDRAGHDGAGHDGAGQDGAGQDEEGQGEVVSSGGRVLSITAVGASLEQARDRAYAGVELVGLPGSQHRTDIALKALRGEIAAATA